MPLHFIHCSSNKAANGIISTLVVLENTFRSLEFVTKPRTDVHWPQCKVFYSHYKVLCLNSPFLFEPVLPTYIPFTVLIGLHHIGDNL